MHIKSFSPWAAPVIIVSKQQDPLNPQKQFWLVSYYQSLKKSINEAHNGNSVISYYPLPNIRDLLARL